VVGASSVALRDARGVPRLLLLVRSWGTQRGARYVNEAGTTVFRSSHGNEVRGRPAFRTWPGRNCGGADSEIFFQRRENSFQALHASVRPGIAADGVDPVWHVVCFCQSG